MATYLVSRDRSRQQDGNSNQRHAVIVGAADAAAAMAAALALKPDGETRVRSTWRVTLLASADPEVGAVWFEGDAVLPGERFRGG